MLLRQTHDGLCWMQFSGLTGIKGVWHGIFLRLGGVSPMPFDSLNVGAGTGDSVENVMANRGRLAAVLPSGTLHMVHQVHGTSVLEIPPSSGGGQAALPQADAMICRSPDHFLMIQVADCQAVMLVDPIRKVVANVHSGWRGSIGNIIATTIAAMKARHHCRPEHIIAAVGPSLGPCCAEFIHYKEEIPPEFWPYRGSRNHFDFWAVSRDQLATAGVKRENIHLSRICTRCNPHLFFSYRAQKRTGRFAAVIGLTQT